MRRPGKPHERPAFRRGGCPSHINGSITMIDIVTGDILIEPGIQLGARFSRPQFLASTLAGQVTRIYDNRPYTLYAVAPQGISGLPFALLLEFYQDKFDAVVLTYFNEDLGTSWSAWSE